MVLLRVCKRVVHDEFTRKISNIIPCRAAFNLMKMNKIQWPEQSQKEDTRRHLSMKKETKFHVRKIKSEDKECVIDFLRKYFLRDEPMSQAVKLINGPNDRCMEAEKSVASAIDEGFSVTAVDENEELVGVVINAAMHKNDCSDYKQAVEKCANPKFRRILTVLMHMREKSRLWEKVPSSCGMVMDLTMASVHPNWRKRHVMEVLARKSETIAKDVGACAIRMDATSFYSGRAAERLGYKNIYSIKYADLPDAPQPEPPHLEARVYMKLLQGSIETMADQDYVIQPVQPGDTEECLELLRKTFFIDEPMNHAVGLCSDGNCAELEEYSAHYLHENGWSFKAVDKNGKIVGVMVSGLSPLKPKDDGSDYVTQAQQCKDPKFAKILYVLAQREEGAKLWEKFPDLDEVLDVKLAATDPNWRKRGIMNNLLAATE
ncbi:hypothetical protein SFRURICE_001182 [Spodoptera frugiperda]|nr:hypothetical protein SFRURICE_001182 [Spodoptera frugiperda]